MEVFCKAVALLHTGIRYSRFLIEIYLRAMGFIRNADDVTAVGQKVQILCKFLNRGQVNATAVATLKLSAQFFPRRYTDNSVVSYIFFGSHKLLGKLIVKVGTVGNDNDCRAVEKHALHEHSCEKKHSVALTAAGGSEICTTFAAALRTQFLFDVSEELCSGKELRIPTDYFQFLVPAVRKIHKVFYNSQQAVFAEQALDHCHQ